MEVMCSAVSSPCLCDFPGIMDCNLGLSAKQILFFPKLILLRVFHHSNRKKIRTPCSLVFTLIVRFSPPHPPRPPRPPAPLLPLPPLLCLDFALQRLEHHNLEIASRSNVRVAIKHPAIHSAAPQAGNF